MPKCLAILIFICFLLELRAQNEVGLPLAYEKKGIILARKFTKEPIALVKALIENKTGDKEKFDAIFAWVASNIIYDFNVYYSSNGKGKTDIKKLLRSKKGICVDYASLMDTLCNIAGVLNVTVAGYAKDEIFDTNDSIYVDNHAWNAVKLDGSWYLYDVTWASGEVAVRYKPFSKFLIKTASKYPERYKQKKIREKKRFFFVDACGNSYNSPSFYYKQKFFNRLIRKIIGLFPLKVEEYYTRRINTDFYLTEPEIFAITHFPDNPIWSLTAFTTMRNFEKDSAFYHLHDSVYKNQNRYGRPCADCDNNLSMGELDKQHYLRNKSFKFNKRNRFVTSLCEHNIGTINFNNSAEIIDSVPKVALLDTSINYLQLAKLSLRTCINNVDVDFLLQKNKNKRKQMLLLEENKNHVSFIKETLNITLVQKRKTKSLLNKSLVNLRHWKDYRTAKLATNVTALEKSRLSETVLNDLMELHNRKIIETDSLNNLLAVRKMRFDSVITNLSLNVWQKVVNHDSLVLPILESTSQRMVLKDNLKKSVVEIRKQIPLYEQNYYRDINTIVYYPSEVITRMGEELYNEIKKRDFYEDNLYRLKLLLVKFGSITANELQDFRNLMRAESRQDYCWLNGKIPSIKTIHSGFKSLKEKQVATLNVIVRENEIERRRTHKISVELLRRKKKFRVITIHNTRVSNAKLIKVKKSKRDYLNQLKKERRRAARKKTD